MYNSPLSVIISMLSGLVKRCTKRQRIQKINELIDLRLRNLSRCAETVSLAPHFLTDQRGEEEHPQDGYPHVRASADDVHPSSASRYPR